MKQNKYVMTAAKSLVCGMSLFAVVGCNDFLDQEPLSNVSPESYLLTEGHLEAYVNGYYGILPSSSGSGGYAPYNDDGATDNNQGTNARYLTDAWTVGQTGGSWEFSNIYALNYFLQTAVPRYNNNSIQGSPENIKHYIGEAYFLRAYEYFKRLRSIGDFPIVTSTLPDNQEILAAASKRMPRNEVARFIINNLDSAAYYMDNNRAKTRITKNAALIMKSRVALYEGTWEKYHAGTDMVPNGPGWPGAQKDYNKGYQFPSGSAENEINYFLEEAMKAAEEVADNVSLTPNNFTIRDEASKPENPYYNMFASHDPSGYDEVVMFRDYDADLGIAHTYNHYLYSGGNTGYTQQFEHAFLMENGLPFYASGSEYAGDDYIQDTKVNRDWRWRLFMKAPGEVKAVDNIATPETFPLIPRLYISDAKNATSTGYIQGKGYSLDYNDQLLGKDETAYIIFRAGEAYLNYIEASYLKKGVVNAKAAKYWNALRNRAGIKTDYSVTVAATDIATEAKYDWGAYSAGKMLDDPILYNIRRERRCEFIAEGFRVMDLSRWRSFDQLNGYQLEGAKIFGPMKDLFVDENGNSLLLYDQADQSKNNVSSPSMSEYLRPNQKTTTNPYYNGFYFRTAHYLEPIAVQNFLNTAPDGASIEQSPIYQNPGWGTVAGEPAQK